MPHFFFAIAIVISVQFASVISIDVGETISNVLEILTPSLTSTTSTYTMSNLPINILQLCRTSPQTVLRKLAIKNIRCDPCTRPVDYTTRK